MVAVGVVGREAVLVHDPAAADALGRLAGVEDERLLEADGAAAVVGLDGAVGARPWPSSIPIPSPSWACPRCGTCGPSARRRTTPSPQLRPLLHIDQA